MESGNVESPGNPSASAWPMRWVSTRVASRLARTARRPGWMPSNDASASSKSDWKSWGWRGDAFDGIKVRYFSLFRFQPPGVSALVRSSRSSEFCFQSIRETAASIDVNTPIPSTL
jgi:hypothetical protein